MTFSDQKVTSLPGIGEKRGARLNKLGLFWVSDFLYYFPRSYKDRREITPIFHAFDGQKTCIKGVVASPPVTSTIRKNLNLTKVKVFDESGAVNITFFNNPYVKQRLAQGQEYIFFGAVDGRGPMKSMSNPIFEKPGKGQITGKIVAQYPLTEGVSQQIIALGVEAAFVQAGGKFVDHLVNDIRDTFGLCTLEQALHAIHFPKGESDIEMARKRLIFDELFFYCLASKSLKGKGIEAAGHVIKSPDLAPFLAALSFELTGAQKRAIDELTADLSSGVRMNRLLQGDVGSGKTVVAAAAAFSAAKSRKSAVIMAPTEILATQHFNNLQGLFAPLGLSCALLTGSVNAAARRQIHRDLSEGAIDILCGTHALLQEGVDLGNAGVIIIDEQHRFGVSQRATLREKAPMAHLLVMSATPIPRTLTLIMYGDLDVSILDELPPNRQKIRTFCDTEERRGRILRFLHRQIKEEGGQAYIVCPLIEGDGESSGRTAAADYAKRLNATLPDISIGLLHGKLKAKEKEAIMADFAAGRLNVLVSTTVIEVGVDVANATLMIVEDADLFGLSQLHQLRGRVGRGSRQSYCILLTKSRSQTALSRLNTMVQTSDGFKIAEADLAQRGPGDFFSNRQHGMPEFKIADIAKNTDILLEALNAANQVFPHLYSDENRPLLQRVEQVISSAKESTLN